MPRKDFFTQQMGGLVKILEIVRTAALVLLALSAAGTATHGVAINVNHSGAIELSCPLPGLACPGVNQQAEAKGDTSKEFLFRLG
jgi:hypothetical protein